MLTCPSIQRKRPGIAWTPGLQVVCELGLAERHKRRNSGELPAPGAEQNVAMRW
jgi:hypothetical protein